MLVGSKSIKKMRAVYFERQIRRRCVLHSLNNLLGMKLVTVEDLNATAITIAKKYAYDSIERRLRSGKVTLHSAEAEFKKTYENYLGQVVSSDGFWSTEVAIRWLTERGWSVKHLPSLPNAPKLNYASGDFLLSVVVDGISHAVVVKRGILFDSLLQSPIFLDNDVNNGFPSNYKILAVYKVQQEKDIIMF